MLWNRYCIMVRISLLQRRDPAAAAVLHALRQGVARLGTRQVVVAEHQAVYTAKWYSQGQTPDAPDVTATATPWRLIGPVLTTDRPPKVKRLAAGTYPAWSPAKVFKASARVLYHRLPYQATWYTQGDRPGQTGVDGAPSPWKALYTIPGEPSPG